MSIHQPQFYYKVDVPQGDVPCIHQARLPPDQQSSFSSLDSEIVSKHYGRKLFEQPRAYRSPVYKKYHYLDRSPKSSERAAAHSLRQGSSSKYEFTLQNSGRVQDYHTRDDKQKRIDELLTENEVLRGQLQMLKSTNSNIQAEVRKGSDEIKRMRRQLDRNLSEHQQEGNHHSAEDQLRDKVNSLSGNSRQLEHDLQLARRKYDHEKQKAAKLEQEVRNLKESLRNYEDRLDQQAFKQTEEVKTSEQDHHRQAKHIRKVEGRLKDAVKQLEEQREQYNSLMVRFRQMTKKDNSHWKDNFVHVFLDMMQRIATKEKFTINQSLSLKKQTKLGWRYLKKLIHQFLGHHPNSTQ